MCDNSWFQGEFSYKSPGGLLLFGTLEGLN